jgi:mono/diheme cytochrome c family protein
MRRFGLYLMAAVLCACDADGDRPGVIVLPGMVYSIPYDAYGRNPITGQTLLVPPEGTVPYGASPFLYRPGPDEATRAGHELRNPLSGGGAVTKATLERGKAVYDVFCSVCHGGGGEGDGPIIGRFPNPPSLLAERARQMPDGQVYHVIYHGQGLMPGYAAQVQEPDRWRAILYLRQLQAAARQPTPSGGTTAAEDPETEGRSG